MIQRFSSFIKQTAHLSISPDLATRSWCVGIFVAWSPFLGLQTVMALLLSYFFQLDARITLVASFVVNNIWTVVPICLINYAFGRLIFDFFQITPLHNPSILEPIERFLILRIGIQTPNLSLFFIGGTLLAFIISASSYPLFKRIFVRFAQY